MYTHATREWENRRNHAQSGRRGSNVHAYSLRCNATYVFLLHTVSTSGIWLRIERRGTENDIVPAALRVFMNFRGVFKTLFVPRGTSILYGPLHCSPHVYVHARIVILLLLLLFIIMNIKYYSNNEYS